MHSNPIKDICQACVHSLLNTLACGHIHPASQPEKRHIIGMGSGFKASVSLLCRPCADGIRTIVQSQVCTLPHAMGGSLAYSSLSLSSFCKLSLLVITSQVSRHNVQGL